MNVQPTYESLRIILWEGNDSADIGAYLIFLCGTPYRVDAPGFLVPPRREVLVKTIRNLGWELRLAKWFPLQAEPPPDQHVTYWTSKVFWSRPLT
jgi:hypothetical protein